MNTNRYDYRILSKDFTHDGITIKEGSLVWVYGALHESGTMFAVIENHCLTVQIPVTDPSTVFDRDIFFPIGARRHPQDKGDEL